MQLSENFTFEELTATSYEAFSEQNMVGGLVHMDSLVILAKHILQPIRDYINQSIHITSGFRCDALNTKVGGSKTSQHTIGLAADIQTGERAKEDVEFLFRSIKNMYKDGKLSKLGQCILEEVNNRYWVHVSVMNEHLFRKYGSTDAVFMITYDGKNYEKVKL